MITTTLRDAVVPSPLGNLRLVASREGLVEVHFLDEGEAGAPTADLPAVLVPYAKAFEAYFGGDLHALEKLPVDWHRGTPFQRRVWDALREIPVGETRSYAWLAHRVGSPQAYRAVGQANGANPVSIVVPCHRVVAADGSLGGYSSGTDRKEWLLAHECAAPPSA